MLVELAVGDAYGAGFEYAPEEFVRQNNDLTQYFRHQSHDIKPGHYTDDAQMSIAIAELIIEDGVWSAENIAHKFVEVFHRDIRPGYARGFFKFLQSVKSGKEFMANIRPDSDKSGAAMRAGPIGLFPTIDEVLSRARIQAKVTHNTKNGITAAQAAALMVHYFFYRQGSRQDVGKFIDQHVPGSWDEDYFESVGSKGWMSVRAAITAIKECQSMSSLLKECIAFTGDVDTVATIALAAACWSDEIEQDLPDILIYNLENGKYGKWYLESLDDKLFMMFNRLKV